MHSRDKEKSFWLYRHFKWLVINRLSVNTIIITLKLMVHEIITILTVEY